MNLILIIIFYLNQLSYENQNLVIDEVTKPVILNFFDSIEYIKDFQIGFYINIYDFKNEFVLISFTDFANLNIVIELKNDNFIYINYHNTNISIGKDIYFFYIKGEIINESLQFTICINNNNQNNKIIEYIFNYNGNFKYFYFNMIKPIWGSNKNLLNFKFIGSILYLGSYINEKQNKFNQLKNVNSKLLVFHSFNNVWSGSSYIENTITNGFSGSLNSYKNNIGIRFLNNVYLIYAIFNQFNSAISLSTDFIKYLSSFEKIIYTFYLSLKLTPRSYTIGQINKINFYFYKRKNLNFYDEISFKNNKNHDFKIFSSYTEEYKGISVNETIFKSIIIKVNNIINNKYLISYEYKTNKNEKQEYNNFKIIREEFQDFNKNDNHIVGFINDKYDNNLVKLKFYINIYEMAFMLGTNLYNINDKLYTKDENKLFLISCNNSNNILKNRNKNICTNISLIFFYKKKNCIEMINNKCVKCIVGNILKNGECNSKSNLSITKSKKYYFKNDKYLNYHNFEIKLINYYKLYEILCYFKSNNNTKITIEINNIKINFNYIMNESNVFKKYNYRFFFKNKFKISFKSNYLFNYHCVIYDLYDFSKNQIDFKSDIFLYKYNTLYIDYLNVEFLINKDNIPSNYFINLEKKAIKCPKNCNKCDSHINCFSCKKNYQLLNGFCVYMNIKTKYILNRIYHSKYRSNKIIFMDFCFKGCLSCNSFLYNECLTCELGYLYYLESKQCIKSNNCYSNYILDNNNCWPMCKKYNSSSQCISCNNMLNLNKNLNKCIKCNTDNNYFKNFKILDSENKPTCDKCDKNCKTCSGNENKCTSCDKNKLIIIDKFICIKNCPKGYYKNNKTCLKCTTNCLNCINQNNCIECSIGKYIKNNLCVNNCGEEYYLNNNKCLNCDRNCLKCNNNFCLKCKQGFYINNKNKCFKCNLSNQFIKNNTCITCSNNCNSCLINKNNCLTCNKGFKLIKKQDLSFCIKNCKPNNFFDLTKNICINCNKCNKCYENNKTYCYNCPKCNKMCKLNIIYDDFGIHIGADTKYGIVFNRNYKIKNLKTKNIIDNNSIKLLFKNNNYYFNLNLSNNIIKSSNNCYNIFKTKFILKKFKTNCFIKKSVLFNSDKKLTLQLETKIIFENNWKLKFYIKDNYRKINYKIQTVRYIKNMSFLLINLYPNYYTNKYDIIMNLNKKFINIHSPCNLISITKKYQVINYKNKIFKPDYVINKENINKFYHNKTLKNIKISYDKYSNVLKNSSLIIIIINIFHTGNMLPLLSIIQLVYFLDLILLIPINLGNNVNTFINYLKLDLDNELNINFIFNINNNEISKYYENKFYINPKISDINWINILNFQIDIIMIILLYIFHFILLILKKIIKPNNCDLINKLIINIKIIRFKLIETFKVIIISILVVYLTNINKFKLDFDNIKIFLIIVFYYIIWCHYFWDYLNSLIYINFTNKNNYEKNNIYFNNIITFAYNNSKLNIYYQIINSLREFLFIIIIFILKNLKIHSFLFWIIQILFIIYIFLWSKKNYFMVQKIKFEEIINLILILSWILNHYFNYEQFQILFIILYLILFGLNLFIMWFNLIYYFYKNLNIKIKQIWILSKNKTTNK